MCFIGIQLRRIINISKNSNAFDPFDFVFIAPGLMIVKNSQSEFVGMTPNMAKLLGYKSADRCIGQTDYDLPCEAMKLA